MPGPFRPPSLPADPSDYDKIDPTDRISILGLKDFVPGKGLTLQVRAEVVGGGVLCVDQNVSVRMREQPALLSVLGKLVGAACVGAAEFEAVTQP
jgi:hypothetical protein